MIAKRVNMSFKYHDSVQIWTDCQWRYPKNANVSYYFRKSRVIQDKFDIFNLKAYHVYKIPHLDSPFVVLPLPGILILPMCIQSLSRTRNISSLIQVQSDILFLSWQQYSRNIKAYLPIKVPLTEVRGSKICKTLCLTTSIEHIDNLRCKRMLGWHIK